MNSRIRAAIKKYGKARVAAVLRKAVKKYGISRVKARLNRSTGSSSNNRSTGSSSNNRSTGSSSSNRSTGSSSNNRSTGSSSNNRSTGSSSNNRSTGSSSNNRERERERARLAEIKRKNDIKKAKSLVQKAKKLNIGNAKVMVAVRRRFGNNSTIYKTLIKEYNKQNINERKTTGNTVNKTTGNTVNKTTGNTVNKTTGNTVSKANNIDRLKKVFANKWNSKERQAVAKKYGINNYTGTKEQNILLKKKIRRNLYNKPTQKSTNNKIKPTQKSTNNKIKPTQKSTNNKIKPTQKSTNNKIKPTQKPISYYTSLIERTRKMGKTDAETLNTVLKKYGKDSEVYKGFQKAIKIKPTKDGTEKVTKDLLNKTEKEVVKTKIDSLKNNKDNTINKVAENYLKSSNIEKTNNKNLQTFYTQMQTQLKDLISSEQARQEAALARNKQSELNKVTGQIRAMLARRGIDISTIPADQIIALSGQIGGRAIENINNAINKSEEDIAKMTAENTDKINQYKEKGLITQKEADKEIERLRQLKEKMISSIKANYVNNVFKIVDTENAKKTKNKGDIVNSVTQFGTSIGLTATQLGLLKQYLNSANPTEAINRLLSDLNNPNSEIYKAIKDNEKRTALISQINSSKKTSSIKPKYISSKLATALALQGIPNTETIRINNLKNVVDNIKDEEKKQKVIEVIKSSNVNYYDNASL